MKDLLFAEVVEQIILKVCRKIKYSTKNPDIQILLYEKIEKFAEVVELLLYKQSLLIDEQKQSILYIGSRLGNFKEEFSSKNSSPIPSVCRLFNKIVSKIQNKAFQNSSEFKEYSK